MKKSDKKSGGDGYWFERSKHWCGYTIAATGPVLEKRLPTERMRAHQDDRKPGSRPRRAARRVYAKAVRYSETVSGGFKEWLRAQTA